MKFNIKQTGKTLARLIIPALILCLSQGSIPSPTPEIYVGASPCDPAVRPLLLIPADASCEMVKWKLAFFKNPENLSNSRYALEYTYGMTKPGTQGFLDGGNQRVQRGTWKSVTYNGKLPGRATIELSPESQKVRLVFLQLDRNLLHLLDTDGHLMIGNGAFSYTVNKNKSDQL